MHDRILAGEIRAGARLMRMADDRQDAARPVLEKLFPHTGRAHIVGITGNPGSGKSTLVDQVVQEFRKRGRRVGVVAIDPSSPFSGGAILGDRIRMQRHATDEGVFIRSLATRGHLGGLTRSTNDVATILDAMGYDVVIIETVGVGQDEVDIVKTAHTSVVVLVPGMGDEIQVMKAGILEIADVFVVNKADRPGAERVIAELETVQGLLGQGNTPRVPILKTVATRNEGICELTDRIEQHNAEILASGERLRRDRARLLEIVRSLLMESAYWIFRERYRELDSQEHLTAKLVERKLSPYTVADELLRTLGK